jgi:RHS repeat-associated protein
MLLRANNRYYSNAYGRFMTPDLSVLGGSPSAPQSWNRYGYATGDPVNRIDPSGLLTCSDDQDDSLCHDPGDDGDYGCALDDASCNPCYSADGFTPIPGPYCQTAGASGPASQPFSLWINLGDDVQGPPVSEADRTRDALWMQQDWAALKTFSTTNKNCLSDLSKFGLTPQSVQSIAGSTRLVNINTLPQSAQSANFNPGADFTAILNITNNGTFRFVVYNQSNFWQSTTSQMAGTLLHEILHVSNAQNYGLTDQQIAAKLGVTITPTNDSAISLKLATDCFPTGN